MNNRLYISNLPSAVSEESLRALFSQKGIVAEVKLMLDPATQQSRGSAFVTMSTSEAASAAIHTFHSYRLEGRNIAVTEARPAEQPVTGLIGEGFDGGIGRFTTAANERGRGTSKGRRPKGKSRGKFRR
jgi:RNA recognition motif-containing protein